VKEEAFDVVLEGDDGLDVEQVKLELVQLFSHYDPKKTLSHLTKKERTNLARLEVLKRPFMKVKYSSPSLDRYIENYLLYSVSLDREGRKEFVKVASSFYSGEHLDEDDLKLEMLRREMIR